MLLLEGMLSKEDGNVYGDEVKSCRGDSEGGGRVKERGGAERILKKLKKKARFFVLHSQIGENMSSDNMF